MQPVERVAGGGIKAIEETAEGRLAGHSFNPQNLGHGRILAQIGHARELISTAKNTPHQAQRHIGRLISVRAGRSVRQNRLELLTHLLLA